MTINVHVHNDTSKEVLALLNLILKTINKMKTDLTEITQEVTESTDAQQSAVILLTNLKKLLDEAGTDAVALKSLSTSLGASTDALAAAIVANTPASGEPAP